MLENKEIWRDCKGYEGLYQVSNMGRIWSLRTQRYLKGDLNSVGYLRVLLKAKNGKVKKEFVHRLVALAFIANPQNKTQVNHKDANKLNNTADNLEWNTCKENINQKNRMEKISTAVLCVETGIIYPSINDAARQLHLSSGHVSEACNGIRETCGGFHWEVIT